MAVMKSLWVRVSASARARYFWRAVGYFVALAIVNSLAYRVVGGILLSSFPFWLRMLGESIAYLVSVVALTWCFCRFADHTSLASLGLHKQRWFAKLIGGWGLGTFLVLLIFATFAATGMLTIESSSWLSLGFMASTVSWIIIAFNEELAFRGYIMQRLDQAWGTPAAVVISSTLFAGVHMLNPNAHLLGIFNLFLGGLLMACAFLVTRSLWVPIGLHMAWNLIEINVLGFPGSGFTDPAILRSITHGPELVTGGAFGPEGGLVATGSMLIGIGMLLLWRRITLTRTNQKEETNA